MSDHLSAEFTVRAPDGSDLASIASTGAPDISTPAKLALAAYAVWRSMVQRAGMNSDFFKHHSPEEMTYGEAQGYRWRGSVNRVIDEMWGWFDTSEDDIKLVKRELNRYLKLSQNLVCVVQGRSFPYTWFVRGEYNDIPPYATPERAPDPRQEKLTPAEAGEDRAPSEVTVENICTWRMDDGSVCGYRAANQTWISRHIFSEHRPAESWLISALDSIGGKSSVQEITDRAAADGYPGSVQHTTLVLRKLADQGLVYGTKNNTSDMWEFWPVVKAPVVVEDELLEDEDHHQAGEIRCREPGCTSPPFEDPYLRNRHESTVHPGSLHREHGCEVCSWERWFYSQTSLARHLNRLHQLRTTDEAYRTAMQNAYHPGRAQQEEEESAKVAAVLPVQEKKAGDLASAITQKLANGVTVSELLGYLSATFGSGEDVSALKVQLADLERENSELRARLRHIRLAAGSTHG
jgi:hypothetical protein